MIELLFFALKTKTSTWRNSTSWRWKFNEFNFVCLWLRWILHQRWNRKLNLRCWESLRCLYRIEKKREKKNVWIWLRTASISHLINCWNNHESFPFSLGSSRIVSIDYKMQILSKRNHQVQRCIESRKRKKQIVLTIKKRISAKENATKKKIRNLVSGKSIELKIE